ncbi:MAG: EamA family transporter RarD [Verrucomicrobia bacterium]|nr:EamA family transporter RarD [Verrucomicrobiota bacterium]
MAESLQEPTASGRPGTPSPRLRPGPGLASGLAAYTFWGVFPLYFRAVAHVPPLVVLCHRVLWSALFLGLVISFRREWRPIAQVVSRRRNLLLLSAGALLIALNWLIFIYAVGSAQTLQASLGYFINPLFSIALGMCFLGERLRKWQWLAVLIATGAVVNLAVRGTGFPWIAVSLAGSFGLYGLVRKKVDVDSLHGLTVESALLLPIAAALLSLLPGAKLSSNTWLLLSLSGVITAVPLLLFGVAVRRLQLSTLGFLQYIGPTLQFLLAIYIFREPLDRMKLVSFALCWLAIAVYVADSILNRRPAPAVADEPE